MINFEAVINSLPFSIFIKSIDGKYVYANESFVAVSGCGSLAAVIGKTDFDMPWAKFAEDYKHQESQLLSAKVEVISHQEQYSHLQASYLRQTYKKLIYCAEHSCHMILGVYDYHSAGSALLEKILHCIPHHIFWKDRYGVFLGCNQAFATAAGMNSPEELIGKTDFDMPWQEQAEKYIADDAKIMASGDTMINFEDKQTRASGEEVVALVSKVPLTYADHSSYGVLGVYADITDIKQKEKKLKQLVQDVRQASLAKTAFISDMSHDLRTPISGIIGLSKKLSEDLQGDDEKSTIAEDIHSAAEKLMQLCNQILEAVEIGSSVNQKKAVNFNLVELVNDVVSIMRASVNHKKLDLAVSFKLDYECFLGYKTLIHRVLLNLVSNAVKFTEQGTVRINVESSDMASDVMQLKIQVSDTGGGITEAQQKLLFNKFHRGTTSYGSRHAGAGLGLYIVKEFVTQMSGSISVDSEIGKGSCFELILPLVKSVAGEDHARSDEAKYRPRLDEGAHYKQIIANLQATKALKMLLVEDDLISRRVGKYAFEKLSLEVDTAEDGAAALRMAAATYYDYIFLDIGLPDMSGVAVSDRINNLPHYINKKNTIIAITAHLPRKKISGLVDSGFSGFVRKPLTPELVLAALKRDEAISCENQALYGEHIE